MENSADDNDGEFELEDVSPGWLPRTGSDSRLLSAAKSHENSSEHVKACGTEDLEMFTTEEAKTVVRKLHHHLVLFLAFLYMLFFLDQSSEYKRIYEMI